MQATIQEALYNLAKRKNLTPDIIKRSMAEIMEGKASQAQIAGFLVGLHIKGETDEEMSAIARSMLERAKSVKVNMPLLLDTCGTGGDASHTFNISTAVAFVCAACGIPVAKHGNRSVSSISGSADVLEALGAKIDLSPSDSARLLNETGITFMFAPLYHPGMKHAAAARKELGIRTVFNLIGPIVNPAHANHRCLGVSSKKYLKRIAKVLSELGVERALVYHSEDGLDEVSLESPVDVVDVSKEGIKEYKLEVKDFGLKRTSVSRIRVKSVDESAKMMIEVFEGKNIPARNYVLANSSIALYSANATGSFRAGVEKAKQAIDSGKVLNKLAEFVESTGGKFEFSKRSS